MYNSSCLECGASLDVPSNIELGEIISCPDCGLELEVKEINGKDIELQEVLLEGEDWGE